MMAPRPPLVALVALVARVALVAPVTVAASAALAGCGFPKAGPAPAPVTEDQAAVARARWPDASPALLHAGREVFLDHCNGCHGYPDVRAIDENEWPGIMERMGKKARLDAEEKESVLRFVLVARRQP